ncbi:MAG: murein L,D-transpeptidase catalytic domain family protein [Chitinophagaceae bacterium]
MAYSSFAFARPGSPRSTYPFAATAGSADTVSAPSVYDSLRLDTAGLSREAFDYAHQGWQKLLNQGRLTSPSVLAIADFSQPSGHRRLYIIDMQQYQLLFHTLVAHGRNSGTGMATSFSNELSSYRSSPGFYITGQTYTGSNGYSLKLEGIEKGINDNAMERAIVVHGADYVDASAIGTRGYIGRSQGCPALSRRDAAPVINTIRNGACFFIYSPGSYASRSALLADSLS